MWFGISEHPIPLGRLEKIVKQWDRMQVPCS